jgi:hypothetical protein
LVNKFRQTGVEFLEEKPSGWRWLHYAPTPPEGWRWAATGSRFYPQEKGKYRRALVRIR